MKDNTPVTVLPPVRIALATITIALISQRAICQPINDPPAQPASPPAPMTAITDRPATIADRIDWTVEGAIGGRSLTVLSPPPAAFRTPANPPRDWRRSASASGTRSAD